MTFDWKGGCGMPFRDASFVTSMDDVMTPLTFEFEFPFNQTYFPYEGNGMRLGKTGRVLGRGLGSVRAVEENACPIVAKLAIPGSDSTLDVRMVGETMMRPLCMPGSKEPCDVATFLASAATMVGWRDSPFDDEPGYGESAKLRPALPRDRFSVRKWGDSEETERRKAVEDRVAALVAVGDTVYVPCPEPTLRHFRVAVRVQAKEGDALGKPAVRTVVGWHLPDFDQYSDPVEGRNRPSDNKYPNRHALADDLDVFRIDREADAVAFLKASAKTFASAYETKSLRVPYVDPSLLTSKDDAATQILRVARSQLVGGHRCWGKLADMDDDAIAAYVAARASLSKPDERTSPQDLREAMESIRAAAPKGYDGERTALLLLRWDLVEADRDLSRILGAETTYDADSDVLLGMAM